MSDTVIVVEPVVQVLEVSTGAIGPTGPQGPAGTILLDCGGPSTGGGLPLILDLGGVT